MSAPVGGPPLGNWLCGPIRVALLVTQASLVFALASIEPTSAALAAVLFPWRHASPFFTHARKLAGRFRALPAACRWLWRGTWFVPCLLLVYAVFLLPAQKVAQVEHLSRRGVVAASDRVIRDSDAIYRPVPAQASVVDYRDLKEFQDRGGEGLRQRVDDLAFWMVIAGLIASLLTCGAVHRLRRRGGPPDNEPRWWDALVSGLVWGWFVLATVVYLIDQSTKATDLRGTFFVESRYFVVVVIQWFEGLTMISTLLVAYRVAEQGLYVVTRMDLSASPRAAKVIDAALLMCAGILGTAIPLRGYLLANQLFLQDVNIQGVIFLVIVFHLPYWALTFVVSAKVVIAVVGALATKRQKKPTEAPHAPMLPAYYDVRSNDHVDDHVDVVVGGASYPIRNQEGALLGFIVRQAPVEGSDFSIHPFSGRYIFAGNGRPWEVKNPRGDFRTIRYKLATALKKLNALGPTLAPEDGHYKVVVPKELRSNVFEAASMVDDARRLIEQDQPDQAWTALADAIEKDPGNLMAYALLARLARGNGFRPPSQDQHLRLQAQGDRRLRAERARLQAAISRLQIDLTEYRSERLVAELDRMQERLKALDTATDPLLNRLAELIKDPDSIGVEDVPELEEMKDGFVKAYMNRLRVERLESSSPENVPVPATAEAEEVIRSAMRKVAHSYGGRCPTSVTGDSLLESFRRKVAEEMSPLLSDPGGHPRRAAR